MYILQHLTELISDIYGSVVLTGKGHRDDTLCLLLLAQHKSLHPDDEASANVATAAGY
jgi:hypothetical protein